MTWTKAVVACAVLGLMLREFFIAAPPQRLLFAWCGLGVFLLHALFKAYLKWALNGWYEVFYNLLQDVAVDTGSGSGDADHMGTMRRAVWDELVEFAWIVAPAVIVHPIAKWIASTWRFTWRMALVESYLAHYDVTCPPVEGAAQRIQEDTTRLDYGIYSCVTMVIDSVLTLIIFIPVLLEVGEQAHPPGWDWPPWLLSIAFSAAWGGLFVSMYVGRRLVVLEVENQKAEARFRTKLVILEQSPAAVVGSDVQQEHSKVNVNDIYTDVSRRQTPRPVPPVHCFFSLITDLWSNYRNLFRNFAAFNLWIGIYNQILILTPYMLVAPLMFAEDPDDRITLGTLMKVTNAFDKVFNAMAIVTENWAEVNNFRSTVRRLREFEEATYTRKRFNHSLLRESSLGPPEVAVAEVVEMTTSTWGESGRVANS